jgi:hypothetical protein
MSFVTEIGYMKMRGVYRKVSKYARNQASGFVTYSLKKGGVLCFQKKSRGPILGYMGYIFNKVNKINTSRSFSSVTFGLHEVTFSI